MIVYLLQSHLEGREEPVLSLPSTTYQETRFRSTLSTNYCYQSLSENIEFFRSQFRRNLLFPRQIKTAKSFFRTLSYNVFCSKPCYCMKDTEKRKVYSMLLCRLLCHDHVWKIHSFDFFLFLSAYDTILIRDHFQAFIMIIDR